MFLMCAGRKRGRNEMTGNYCIQSFLVKLFVIQEIRDVI